MGFELNTEPFAQVYTFLTIAQDQQIKLILNLPWPYFVIYFVKAIDVISHNIILKN